MPFYNREGKNYFGDGKPAFPSTLNQDGSDLAMMGLSSFEVNKPTAHKVNGVDMTITALGSPKSFNLYSEDVAIKIADATNIKADRRIEPDTGIEVWSGSNPFFNAVQFSARTIDEVMVMSLESSGAVPYWRKVKQGEPMPPFVSAYPPTVQFLVKKAGQTYMGEVLFDDQRRPYRAAVMPIEQPDVNYPWFKKLPGHYLTELKAGSTPTEAVETPNYQHKSNLSPTVIKLRAGSFEMALECYDVDATQLMNPKMVDIRRLRVRVAPTYGAKRAPEVYFSGATQQDLARGYIPFWVQAHDRTMLEGKPESVVMFNEKRLGLPVYDYNSLARTHGMRASWVAQNHVLMRIRGEAQFMGSPSMFDEVSELSVVRIMQGPNDFKPPIYVARSLPYSVIK